MTGTSPAAGAPSRSRLTSPLPALLGLTLLLHLPFAGQAIQGDDGTYLEIARSALANPLFPLDRAFVFEGRRVTLWGHTHPPLTGYTLAALIALDGGRERELFLHSAYLAFPLVATLAFWSLAQRFVRRPALATATFVTLPTLMVTAHLLTCDVPLTACWLSAVALFLRGVDRQDARLRALALLPMTAAAFYAYQGLAIPILLAFYAIRRRRFDLRTGALLSTPLACMFAWQFSGYLHLHVTYVGQMFGYLAHWHWGSLARLPSNGLSVLAYLGSVFVLPLLAFLASPRPRRLAAVAGTVTLCVMLAPAEGYDLLQRFCLGLCVGGGVAILGVALAGACRDANDSDEVFLALWILGVLFYCVVLMICGSARYLLPAAAPLVLLVTRRLEEKLDESDSSVAGVRLALVLQLALGLAVCHADYEFAGVQRRAAEDAVTDSRGSAGKLWFSGEWGFRYYLDRLGAEILREDSHVTAPAIVIKSRLCLSRSFGPELEGSLHPVRARTYRVTSPLRLLDPDLRVSFWSDGWGPLPFWFSRGPLDVVTEYEYQPQKGR